MAKLPSTAAPASQSPLVSVIVVTYKTPVEMLLSCVYSLVASKYRPLELVVVDNSPDEAIGECLSEWQAALPAANLGVVYLPQRRNLGYAIGTNYGIQASSGDLLFLLNPDTRIESDALTFLVGAANRKREAIGFAPKVLLQSNKVILDSVGIDLYPSAQGAQRGLGEPDIGQFDIEERVAGLCFAAALIRREAFSQSRVGLLDEHYFMFYEDVDWSVRAALFGETFWAVPWARVCHVHSASTRAMAPGFKTRLIQRNLLWTAAKNLETRRVARALAGHAKRALGRGAREGHILDSLRIVIGAAAGAPWVLVSRRYVQRARSIPDEHALSEPGLGAPFDAVNYRPIPSVSSLASVLGRLYAVKPSADLGRLMSRLDLTNERSVSRDPGHVANLVRESGLAIGPGLEWLLSGLEAADGDPAGASVVDRKG